MRNTRKPRTLAPEFFELVASRFQALGEPARLRILHALSGGELIVGQIVKKTKLSQANVSKHLALLVREGFISRRKSGLFVYYTIVDPAVFELCNVVCSGIDKRSARQGRVLEHADAFMQRLTRPRRKIVTGGHSTRNATFGSTRAARRAGK